MKVLFFTCDTRHKGNVFSVCQIIYEQKKLFQLDFLFTTTILKQLILPSSLLMATPSGTPKKTSSQKKTPTPKKTTTKKTATKPMTTAETVASTEKVVDTAVEKVTKKAAEHVSPELREKATKVAHQAESFATEVEKFGDSV